MTTEHFSILHHSLSCVITIAAGHVDHDNNLYCVLHCVDKNVMM